MAAASSTSQRATARRPGHLLAALLLATCANAHASGFLAGLDANLHGDLGRWFSLYGSAFAAYQAGEQHVGIAAGNLGVALHVTPLLDIAVEGGGAAGIFRGADNRDVKATIKESIFVNAPSGMSYYVIFEQRKLWAHPSGYLVESSRGDAGVAWRGHTPDQSWRYTAAVTCVLNLKAEDASWPLFRRAVVALGADHRITRRLRLGIEYRCHLGGRGQRTFGEDCGLHAVRLTLDYHVSRRRTVDE